MAVEHFKHDYVIACTVPDQIDRHDISDEELTMLVDPRRDRLSDQKWGYFGVCGGAAIPALTALFNYLFHGRAMGAVEGITTVFFFAFGAVALHTHLTDKRLALTPSTLAAKIRARTRKRVQGVQNAGE
jgi:hypothetical protein